MSKLRVHELAKELNIESKILMAKLKAMGAKVLSHQSTLTDQQVNELRGALVATGSTGAVPAAAAAASAAASSEGGGKPRVVIRRRVATKDEGEGGDVTSAAAEAEFAASAPEAAVPQRESGPEAPVELPAAPAVELPQAKVSLTPEAPAVTTTTGPVVGRATSATIVRSAAPSATGLSVTKPARIQHPSGFAPRPSVAAPSPHTSVEPETKLVEEQPEIEDNIVAEEVPLQAEPTAVASAPAVTPPAPVTPSAPAAPAAPPAAASAGEAAGDGARRRREVGGATIVRRATPEEVEKLESANRSRQTGRKEDHRGTRVTGLGLLSNRVSAAGAAPGPSGNAPPAAGGVQPSPESEDWGSRRPAVGAVAKDKKTLDEEELARKKAAAKARRNQGAINTRLLLQQAEILTSDEEVQQAEFSGRTVYTPMAPRTRRDVKRRKDLKKTMITVPRASYRVVMMGESITVAELAKQLAIKSSDLIKKLMAQGVMATINQAIDFDTATLLAGEYQFEVKSNIQTVDDIIQKEQGAGAVDLESRPPIVTVMGHVDHGKTSILDAIRSADVASGEAGGITQHIGAYSVEHDGKRIAFLDTPGHEAFSAMRARGAKVTDIVVLVVAADDGVMPQTIEAINHAKAANVPLIVAVNKIDKPNINLDRVYTELTEHGIQAEEWGGETQFIKTSALQRQGIDELLEAILLQSEVLDLKATRVGHAEGVVIEAHLDKGRGPVATVMVQSGTLRPGDYIVAGSEYGRVRAMHDHKVRDVSSAGPSEPVEIIGLSGVPRAGDRFNIVEDERTAREVSSWRLEQARRAQSTKSSAASLADLLAKVKNEEVPEVPIIVKADTQGSVEAIVDSILKLNTDKVRNRIVHSAVGGVNESDISLAQASGSVVIGFNVRAGRGLDEMAEQAGVPIQYFSIIYEIVDSIKALMVGKLPPIVSELVLGRAEVRKPISVPKIGMIGGSAVLEGKITRTSFCRLIRNDIVIYSGKLGSLRRFKDDVKEVVQGYECGIGIDGYNDLKEGDIIEAYVLEETSATL
ncbi:MAG: translation initiation factor IF-2 [Proteobacteria bacterium]|nr:translation initiation factor IF-2 [Pseudomonadota bacterium]